MESGGNGGREGGNEEGWKEMEMGGGIKRC